MLTGRGSSQAPLEAQTSFSVEPASTRSFRADPRALTQNVPTKMQDKVLVATCI